jgi:PEP-CTERM motif
MKMSWKLSALGAVLVLSTAFASADIIQYKSSSSGSVGFLGYNASSPTGPFAIQPAGTNNSTGTGATFGISPGTVWAPPLIAGDGSVSSWVSYDRFSGPTGGETSSTFDANGYYEYTTNFNLPGGNPSVVDLTIAADDTVAVYLGAVNAADLVLAAGTIGGDQHCADGDPNCRPDGSSEVVFDAPAGFNVLNFVVYQTGSNYQGLDYVYTVTETPEPNTLILLGTGLLGTAGALFRKMRTA